MYLRSRLYKSRRRGVLEETTQLIIIRSELLNMFSELPLQLCLLFACLHMTASTRPPAGLLVRPMHAKRHQQHPEFAFLHSKSNMHTHTRDNLWLHCSLYMTSLCLPPRPQWYARSLTRQHAAASCLIPPFWFAMAVLEELSSQ